MLIVQKYCLLEFSERKMGEAVAAEVEAQVVAGEVAVGSAGVGVVAEAGIGDVPGEAEVGKEKDETGVPLNAAEGAGVGKGAGVDPKIDLTEIEMIGDAGVGLVTGIGGADPGIGRRALAQSKQIQYWYC